MFCSVVYEDRMTQYAAATVSSGTIGIEMSTTRATVSAEG
jgi:hypothetical protein